MISEESLASMCRETANQSKTAAQRSEECDADTRYNHPGSSRDMKARRSTAEQDGRILVVGDRKILVGRQQFLPDQFRSQTL